MFKQLFPILAAASSLSANAQDVCARTPNELGFDSTYGVLSHYVGQQSQMRWGTMFLLRAGQNDGQIDTTFVNLQQSYEPDGSYRSSVLTVTNKDFRNTIYLDKRADGYELSEIVQNGKRLACVAAGKKLTASQADSALTGALQTYQANWPSVMDAKRTQAANVRGKLAYQFKD